MKKIKLLTFILAFIIFLILGGKNTNAVSLTISLSDTTATSGDTVSVKINGNGITGKVALSASDGGSISPSTVWVDNNKESATLTITGNKDVTVTAKTVDASNSSDASPYTGSTSATVKVKDNSKPTEDENSNNSSATDNNQDNSKPTNNETNIATPVEKKSNNANLKNLGIKPNDFKGFKSGTTSYSVTVPNDVEKVTVYADKSDAKATISGVGSKKLEVGKNALEVVVTAEDGTKKTYTINVTREEKKVEENTINNTVNENTTNETTENTVAEENTEVTTKKSDLVKLEVAGFTLSPKFSPDLYEYKLQVKQDVTDLKVEAKGIDDKVKIDIAGNTSLQMGENVITVLVSNEETKKTSTYQIMVEKIEENENDATDYAQIKGKKIRYILIGLFAIFVLAMIITAIIIKRKSEDSIEGQYEYDEEDEEKINLDEEEEFFKRVNKTKLKSIQQEDIKKVETPVRNLEEIENNQSIRPKRIRRLPTENDEEEDEQEYFRTSKSSKKGKHF